MRHCAYPAVRSPSPGRSSGEGYSAKTRPSSPGGRGAVPAASLRDIDQSPTPRLSPGPEATPSHAQPPNQRRDPAPLTHLDKRHAERFGPDYGADSRSSYEQ